MAEPKSDQGGGAASLRKRGKVAILLAMPRETRDQLKRAAALADPPRPMAVWALEVLEAAAQAVLSARLRS